MARLQGAYNFSCNCPLSTSAFLLTFIFCFRRYRFEFQIHQLSLVPPLVLFLAKSPLVETYDLRSVMIAGSGGAPLAQEIQNEACKRLGVRQLGQGMKLNLKLVPLWTIGVFAN